jgi:glutamyl-tRNA reductase
MNGPTTAEALAGRFRAIRESELARLKKKLRDLTEDDRKSVEAIAAQVTDAIAQVPQRALQVGVSQQAVDVLIRVFELTSADS